jgi:hypothetical protein
MTDELTQAPPQEVILYDPMQIENKVKLEALRLGLQTILDGVSSIVWTEQNINQDLLAPARNAVKTLRDFIDAKKRPHLNANTALEKSYKEVTTLIISESTAKASEKKVLAEKMAEEKKKQDEEKKRVEEIEAHIVNFITNCTTNVLRSESERSMSVIEMAIGSQLSRKSYFAEYYDEFVEKIKPLRELISQRKAIIKERDQLETKREKASGEELEGIVERKGDLSINLIQNQSEMYNAVEAAQPAKTYVGQSTAPYVVPSRRQWTYEVTDLKELHKSNPQLVTIEPNTNAIRQLISEYRTKGELKDDSEINLKGLRIFQEKTYK